MNEEKEFKVFDARLKTPFSLIIAGPSNSGKTTFVNELLLNQDRVINNRIDYVFWFYGQVPPKKELFDRIENLTAVQGIPDSFKDYILPERTGIIILDDLMQECTNNSLITDFFTRKSHHENICVIFITQNLFHSGRERINFIKNTTYLTLFNSPMDQSLPIYMAQKLLPTNRKAFMDIYNHAVDKPHGYLFIDGHQETPKAAKFRTDLFEVVQRVFIPLAK